MAVVNLMGGIMDARLEIRLDEDTKAQIAAIAGHRNVSDFVRAAIEKQVQEHQEHRQSELAAFRVREVRERELMEAGICVCCEDNMVDLANNPVWADYLREFGMRPICRDCARDMEFGPYDSDYPDYLNQGTGLEIDLGGAV